MNGFPLVGTVTNKDLLLVIHQPDLIYIAV